ncbi:ATP-binding protein [Pedobacter sp. P351]|uniref:ATP-binding response regulator n=1 Tax=Pedobacter superstes TaxID=3133441 RepID=UPI00309C736C
MIITDEEILEFIRKSYKNHKDYKLPDAGISKEEDFTIVRDIHDINEDELDITKDIYIRKLKRNRQTNSINIINICDSVAAESNGLDEEIYAALEEYNKIYTKPFLRNGSRWVDIGAFNLCCEKARELLGNRNPRTLYNISKYTYLLNNTVLNTANLRLSLVNIRSCLELMHLEIRKMNYDMIMRPVGTFNRERGSETLIQTKYVNNFSLHNDIHLDHEFLVFGIIAGLVAKKNRGVFGEIKPYFYQFNLVDVLKKDYAYLGLQVNVGEGLEAPIYVNNKLIAHRVLLRKKNKNSDFSAFSRLTGRLLAGYQFPKSTDIYDYSDPVELQTLSQDQLDGTLKSRKGIIVYRVDETLFDSYSFYDTINPQSGIVVEKGEFFNAPYNLFGINYVDKTEVKNLWGFWEQILLFSKTNRSDQLQRIKLFDSMMQQQRNAISRAEQAEKLVKQLQISNEQINELNANLTEKVKERTHQLEQLNEQQRTNFINLVHETKTPLTLVNNYLEEYINTYGSVHELNIIKTAVNKLTKDIISLFDIERFNKGIGVYKHDQICNFSTILQESLMLFEHYCQKQKLKCEAEIESDVLIKADPNAINRIVNNLLENSVKFSSEEGSIKVILLTAGDKIVFTISDSGKGIPVHLQKKVFEPYFQINHETTNLQGMGLGLPIVKKVTDSLNGTIKVESNPDKKSGTTISITLNAHRLNKDEFVAETPKSDLSIYNIENPSFLEVPHSEGRPTILLVEDNKAMLHYLYKKLCILYNVYYAFNGAEALRLLQNGSSKPDLIVSDIMMDKMDGFEFARILSETKSFNHIPIIFLTAKATHPEKLKGLRLGAIDWIQKPFSYEELQMKIKSLLDTIENQQKLIANFAVSSLKQNDFNDKHVQLKDSPSFELACRQYRFTDRESEIIYCILDGMSNKSIAEKLFISDRTVSTHIHNIFQKTEVGNRMELVKKIKGK